MAKLGIIAIILTLSGSGDEHRVDWDKLLYNRINEYRIANGLNELVWDEKLHDAAHHHSRYLSLVKDCVHEENEKADGIKRLKEPEDRLKKYVTKDFRLCLENVAWDGGTDELPLSFFTIWKESPPHNRNMLTKSKRKIYCAVCIIKGDGEAWATMIGYIK